MLKWTLWAVEDWAFQGPWRPPCMFLAEFGASAVHRARDGGLMERSESRCRPG